jgi:hypothetical protein
MAFRGFEQTLTFAPGSAEDRAVSRDLAQFARQQLREAQQMRAFPGLYLTAVNGRRTEALDDVDAPGPIVFTAEWIVDAAAYCIGFLRARAPARSGAYRNSIQAFADGQPVDIEQIPLGAEVTIGSDLPYSRKVQVGSKGFETSRGIYDQAAAATGAEFRGLVQARATFMDLAGRDTRGDALPYRFQQTAGRQVAYVQNNRSRGFRAGRTSRFVATVRAGQEMRYPAVRLTTAVTGAR